MIIEKKLGITGDYQYKALTSHNYLQSNWHNNKLVIVNALFTKYRPQTILDLGTGSGNFELAFAKRVKSIVGIDYNDEALAFLKKELNRRNISNVKLICRDILDIPRGAELGKFDLILMTDVLEHLEMTRSGKLIADLKMLLSPRGKVVIITPNYGGVWPVVEKIFDIFSTAPHLNNLQHITKYTPVSLRAAFKRSGYQQVGGSTFNLFSFLIPTKKLSAAVCKFEFRLKLPWGNLISGVYQKL